MLNRMRELAERIQQENDPERRYVFLLFSDITAMVHDLTTVIQELSMAATGARNEHNAKIALMEAKICAHDVVVLNGTTTINILKGTLSMVLALGIGISSYGYSLIADLRDEVTKQSVILPRLETIVSEIRAQSKEISENRSTIKQQDWENAAQDGVINKLDTDVKAIKHKRVVRASK